MKALFIIFDLTNPESLDNIDNHIKVGKKYFEICKKYKGDLEGQVIKQPELFEEIPISIIGNKSDLKDKKQIQKAKIEEVVNNIKTKYNFKYLNYYEISVKENIGLENIFQDVVVHYLKRKFHPIIFKSKNSLNRSRENSNKELPNPNNENNKINDNDEKDLVLDIKEEKKEKKKRPSMDKSIIIFHQLIDKVKRQFYFEINSLKDNNQKELDKIKSEFNNENKILNEKLSLVENKNKELEEQIKIKNKEIENLKQKLGNVNILKEEDIYLKFKIPDEKFKNEIIINTFSNKRMSEVMSTLYEICPYLNNLKVKSLCLDGNNSIIIDEMKTIKENKLVNGSVITLTV